MTNKFSSQCIFSLIMLCIFLVSFHAKSEEILRVGIVDDYLPWEAHRNNKAVGVNIKIVERIAEKLNLSPSFRPVPFKRMLKYLREGKLDIACSLTYKPERAIYIDYIKPAYGPSTKVFLILKNRNIQIDSYQDLSKYHIGLRLGHKQFPQFDSDTQLKKIEVDGNDQLFKLLLSGRIDAIIGTQTQLWFQAKQLGYAEKIKEASFKLDKGRSAHCGLSKNSKYAYRKHEIEAIIQEMLDSKEIDQLIEQQKLD